MAEGSTDFNVQYSGAGAKALVDKIEAELTAAKNAHTAAINAWRTVKSKFTLSSDSMAKLNSIDEEGTGLDAEEFQKVVTSLENMISGVGNINTSWQNVSSEIDSAIETYISGQGQ